MNNLFNSIRFWIRSFLLKLAKDLKPSESKGPAIRKSRSLFQKEIKIPVFIPFIFTIITVYGMLVTGVGIYLKIMFAALIFMIAIVVFFAAQIQNKEKAVLDDNDTVVLMCLLFINSLLTFQVSKEYLSPFASPVSAFSIMAAMLLSLCPITLKDLELTRDSIISTIMGIYHARIEYK
ncbi:MAG: hypothetical protein LBS61_04775 [Endomicrobium sp.]|jgi:membrane-associated HD superfamily phosphohydrolase|nr:hypothetical protein [Endomicrobium sp.]